MSKCKQTIKVALPDGVQQEVEATVISPFAYHGTVLADGTLASGVYTITHIPTGYALSRSVISKAHAGRAIGELIERAPEWEQVTTDFESDLYKQVLAASLPVVKRYRMRGWL